MYVINVCMFVCMYVRMYVCMHACNFTSQCMRMCVYIYIYIFLNTHTTYTYPRAQSLIVALVCSGPLRHCHVISPHIQSMFMYGIMGGGAVCSPYELPNGPGKCASQHCPLTGVADTHLENWHPEYLERKLQSPQT